MFGQLTAIARNTFYESIRQPIVLVLVAVATILLVLSNPLSAFTLEGDQRMLIDIGMATIFLAGCILASFVATGVIAREIENRTALTVVSKPVPRAVFVIGKFLGVGSALVLTSVCLCFVFLLVERHTVLETVRDPVHLPVITFGILGLVLGLGIAVWCNYFYGKVFASTAIVVTTPLLALAYLFSLMFRADFTPQPIREGIRVDLWLGLFVMIVAVLVLAAIAVAASARFGQVMTLVITFGFFLLGLLSDWIVGRRIRAIEAGWLDAARIAGLTEMQERYLEYELQSGEIQRSYAPQVFEVATVPLTQMAEGGQLAAYYGWWTLYSIIPNLQMLWLSDALTQSRRLPLEYIAAATGYGVLYIIAAVAIGIVVFQRREVG
ncbi:MAG: ABC transporter permease subunit [Phycisphaeraceae bacterium]|nr:ABC transporter permease subunit [Phycisphaeraceae bacterium]